MILDLERNGWRLISTIKCKNHVILCCLSMGSEGRVDLVRLLGFYGYGMNTVPLSVKTTPQMTRFRDGKLCDNLATDEIDDHGIQSDYKCKSGLQNPEGKNSTLGIASAW